MPLLVVMGRGGESGLRPVLVGFIIRPLVEVDTSRGVCGMVKKNFSIRPIAREGVREGNVGELIKFNIFN